MELWQTILAAVTGNVLALGVLGFLGKSLIENLLAKNAKKFEVDLKAAADSATEHLKSQLQGKLQLRMAAVDVRLKAHQESFTYWRKLLADKKEGEDSAVIQCQAWWDRNCLYLEPAVRQAFLTAFHNAHTRQLLLESRAPHEDITQSFQKIMDFPEVLFKSVQLPGLTVEELEVAKQT